jgi:hypothetical protein
MADKLKISSYKVQRFLYIREELRQVKFGRAAGISADTISDKLSDIISEIAFHRSLSDSNSERSFHAHPSFSCRGLYVVVEIKAF